jgi:hypothetical protein
MVNINPKMVTLIEVVRKNGRWCIVIHWKVDEREPVIQEAYTTKAKAARVARAMGRWIAETQGSPVQLHIKKRNGQIPAGGHGVETYGNDPVKYKG